MKSVSAWLSCLRSRNLPFAVAPGKTAIMLRPGGLVVRSEMRAFPSARSLLTIGNHPRRVHDNITTVQK
jgi:hypothetical protein